MGNFYGEVVPCSNYFVLIGFIGKITLQIPLSRLHSEPWVISMERLYLAVISMERLYLAAIILCFQVLLVKLPYRFL